MATYTGQGYDPNSYQVAGYQAPNEAILNTLNARTSYYINSARQIKTARDNALNMTLTNEQNIASLDAQTQQIDDQLGSIVKKDLSNGDYQKQALNLFKPIVTNHNFLYDEQVTNQIHSGLQRAQTDSKNKGASYMNIESVKALNNKLDDLRTADVSQNNWQEPFTNDTLGTTYIPYDPQVDKDYNTGLQKFVKDTRSKYTGQQTKWSAYNPDGSPAQGATPVAYYLSEQQVNSQTAMDMKDYIRQNRPQQQQTLVRLRAKNDAHDLLANIKASPIEGMTHAVSYINALKQNAYNSDVSIVNKTVNNIVSNQLGIASPDSEQYKALQRYKEKLIGTDGKGGYMSDLQLHYDNIKAEYILNNPSDLGSFTSLYDALSVNSQVEALGLDRTEQTLKADQSATSIANNRESIQARLQVAALEAQTRIATAKGTKAPGTPGAFPEGNSHITPTEDVSGIPSESGAIKLQNVQAQMLMTEDDARKDFLATRYAAVVPIDGKNVNVLDAMAMPQYRNMPFKAFLDKVNLPSSTRELMEALHADVYADNDVTKTTAAQSNTGYAATRILAAMHDDKKMNEVLQRAGYDLNEQDNIAELGFQMQDLKNNRDKLSNDFGGAISTAVAGMGRFSNLSNDQLINLNEEGYIKSIAGELTSKNIGAIDIKHLEEDLKAGSPTGSFKAPSSDMNYASAIQSQIPNWQNLAIEPYIKEWTAFKQAREQAVNASGSHVLANGVSFEVVTPSELTKTFDATAQIYQGDIPNILSRAHTSIDGTNSGTAGTAFGQIKSRLGAYLQNVRVYDDRTGNPYIRMDLKSGAAKKLLEDTKQEDIKGVSDFLEGINSTKFYIPKEDLSNFGFGPASTVKLDYANGNPHNYKLTSGSDVTFRNAGLNGETNIVPDGKMNDMVIYDNGDIEILEGEKVNAQLLQQKDPSGGLLAATQIAPKEVIKRLYGLDYRATQMMNILRSNGIKENKININSLQTLKEKDRINKIFTSSGGQFR